MHRKEGLLVKVLILSDSHRSGLVNDILKKERNSDIFIHLGDGGSDMFDTGEFTGGKPVYNVKGNCDTASYGFPEKLISYFGSVKFYACHGHNHNVKNGLSALFYAAKQEQCTLALFGHTHIALNEEYEDVILFNPGSAMNGRYGILEISGDKMTLKHCSL